MGFFSNPIKAIKGAVNRFVPGGRYLTGAARDHQKFHYNAALDRYNSYASAAQNQINSLSQSLQQQWQNLRSLEEQKYQHGFTGQQLSSHVSQYEGALANLERQKSAASLEAQNLEKAVSAFKAKAPALAGKISEVEKLPSNFENLYSKVASQKERLAGLSGEEAGNLITKHKADVEVLKKQRQDTEGKIRAAMAEIAGEHGSLGREKANLEQSLERYKHHQDRLLQENNSFQQQRTSLQKVIEDYKNEQDRITREYSRQQLDVQSGQQNLQNYINAAQSQLNALGGDVEWRAGKCRREAGTTGLVQGGALALGGLALGAGLGSLAGNITTSAGLAGTSASTPLSSTLLGSLATGLKYAAPLVGVGHYLNTANRGNLRGFERAELGSSTSAGGDLSQIARYGLGSPKVAIPELGGLKQSLSHFDMPIVPKLKDLPQLHEALGKIVSL